MGFVKSLSQLVLRDRDTNLTAQIETFSGKNRLLTDAVINSPAFSTDIQYRVERLLNAGSKMMNVNGSVTPQHFDYVPAVGETWYVEQISFLLVDGGGLSATEFGSLGSALTNGLRLVAKQSGTEYEVADLHDNTEVVLTFTDIAPTGSASGIFGTIDALWGTLKFNKAIRLVGASDYFRATVRDNLTAIEALSMQVIAWRILP